MYTWIYCCSFIHNQLNCSTKYFKKLAYIYIKKCFLCGICVDFKRKNSNATLGLSCLYIPQGRCFIRNVWLWSTDEYVKILLKTYNANTERFVRGFTNANVNLHTFRCNLYCYSKIPYILNVVFQDIVSQELKVGGFIMCVSIGALCIIWTLSLKQ